MKIVKKIELVKKIHNKLVDEFDEQDRYFFLIHSISPYRHM